MTKNQKLIRAINGFVDIQKRYEAHLSHMVGAGQAWGAKNPDNYLPNNEAFNADIAKLAYSDSAEIICLAGNIVAAANQEQSFDPYCIFSVEMKPDGGKRSVLFCSYGEMRNVGTAENPHLELEINKIEVGF